MLPHTQSIVSVAMALNVIGGVKTGVRWTFDFLTTHVERTGGVRQKREEAVLI